MPRLECILVSERDSVNHRMLGGGSTFNRMSRRTEESATGVEESWMDG